MHKWANIALRIKLNETILLKFCLTFINEADIKELNMKWTVFVIWSAYQNLFNLLKLADLYLNYLVIYEVVVCFNSCLNKRFKTQLQRCTSIIVFKLYYQYYRLQIILPVLSFSSYITSIIVYKLYYQYYRLQVILPVLSFSSYITSIIVYKLYYQYYRLQVILHS